MSETDKAIDKIENFDPTTDPMVAIDRRLKAIESKIDKLKSPKATLGWLPTVLLTVAAMAALASIAVTWLVWDLKVQPFLTHLNNTIETSK